jgi:hypothetical protein
MSFIDNLWNVIDFSALIVGLSGAIIAFYKFNKTNNLDELKIINQSLTDQNTSLSNRINDLDNS